MKKLSVSFFTILICSFLISSQVWAHSYLQQSFPSHGDVIEDHVQTVSLTFDAGIESSSVVELFRSNGEEVPLLELIVDSPYMEATFLEPLPTDDYRLHWIIIGDDGHPTDGTVEFSIILPDNEEEANNTEAEVDIEQEEAVEEDTDEVADELEGNVDIDEEVEREQITEENQENSMNLLLIGILFVAFLIVLFLLSKRKR